MEQLIINLEGKSNANLLLELLGKLSFVKSVSREKVKEDNTPLTAADWVRPGRPATEEELEQLAIEMEAEKGGVDSSTFFKQLKKKYK